MTKEEKKSVKKTVKKKKTKKEEKPQPDYDGFDRFISIFVGGTATEKLKAISDGIKTYHLTKSEAVSILEDKEREAKNKEEEPKEEKEEVKLTLEDVEFHLKDNLYLGALELDRLLSQLSESSEISKTVLVKRIEELRKIDQRNQENPKTEDMIKKEKNIQELESYESHKMNWIEGDYWKDWDGVKGHMKKLWKDWEGDHKWIFLGHSKDTIRGKPQLIEQVQKKIPLVRLVSKKMEIGRGIVEYEDDYIFIDDKFDKRYDGKEKEAFAMDFWLYRIIDGNGKEYYIFTQEQLPNETCTFKGMLIEMDDFAEVSRSMKIKSLSRIFFMKEFEPSVKILSKEEIVNFTKAKEITEDDWLSFISYHKLGTYNNFPKEMELLRSAFLLCGRAEGWPMHLGVMGPAGTRKTMGHIETVSHKFFEDPSIIEGGDSRIKALSPSFKEKPANIGYLARSERMGWVDEIGKMVEFEVNKHQTQVNNVLGELNFLLEHKKRTVGSGNDNECQVQANAKFMFVTNPVSNKHTLQEHVGIMDSTTMSRIVWWVQDEEEQKFVLGEEGITDFPPHIVNSNRIEECLGLCKCWGKLEDRDQFLTLYDTCYSFMCDIDNSRVEKLVQMSTALAQEPMKSSVWKPRARHHIRVILDGLVKHRCLFKDYDATFTPKDEDYEICSVILERMVRSWNTNLRHKVQSEGTI